MDTHRQRRPECGGFLLPTDTTADRPVRGHPAWSFVRVSEELRVVRKVDVTLIDDLDGMSADDTVVFGYRGTWFEIDLSAENAAQIHGLLTEWSNRGRRSEDISTARRRTAADRAETAAIRTWARGHGFAIADRGRIADSVVAAYRTRARPPSREDATCPRRRGR
jgi:hypothetical protein